MTPIVTPLSTIADVVALVALDTAEHGLQCAYELSKVAPDDLELQVAGLVQAWIQDAGGFAALGLVVYLLYAMSTPTDKSQSEKIRSTLELSTRSL